MKAELSTPEPTPLSGDPVDICTRVAGWMVNIRVGALVVGEGHILLDHDSGRNFYFLPGGRIQAGEDSRAALSRELLEEAGVIPSDLKLWMVLENFFIFDNTPVHEIGIYYYVNSVTSAASPDFESRLEWLPFSKFQECIFLPLQLQQDVSAVLVTPEKVPQFIHRINRQI